MFLWSQEEKNAKTYFNLSWKVTHPPTWLTCIAASRHVTSDLQGVESEMTGGGGSGWSDFTCLPVWYRDPEEAWHHSALTTLTQLTWTGKNTIWCKNGRHTSSDFMLALRCKGSLQSQNCFYFQCIIDVIWLFGAGTSPVRFIIHKIKALSAGQNVKRSSKRIETRCSGIGYDTVNTGRVKILSKRADSKYGHYYARTLLHNSVRMILFTPGWHFFNRFCFNIKCGEHWQKHKKVTLIYNFKVYASNSDPTEHSCSAWLVL